jgi:hypothetical protein
MTANRMCRSSRGRDRVDPVTFLSPPPRSVTAMSCTPIPDPLMDVLATVAAHPGIPVDRLDLEQYGVAVDYGWLCEYRGRVGLTGAGA